MRVLAAGTVMVDVMAVGLSHVAEPGEVVYTEVETHIGGHPIDVAIDLVRLGQPAETVAVVAAIGTGPYGTFARDVIDRAGVTAFVQEVSDRDTGRNLVLSVEGEDRRFHLDAGANWVLRADHVSEALRSWEPDLFTLRPGYTGFDLHLDEILASLDGATTVLLDVMQPHPTRPAGYARAAVQRADIVHCNEHEARFITGADTIAGAVAEFLGHGVKLVLVTRGELGASAHTARWQIDQPPFTVDVVDATGCGDAFCAGVIHRLGRNGFALEDPEAGDLVDLLLEGQAVGAAAATAPGCVTGVGADIVNGILGSQGDRAREGTNIIERSGS